MHKRHSPIRLKRRLPQKNASKKDTKHKNHPKITTLNSKIKHTVFTTTNPKSLFFLHQIFNTFSKQHEISFKSIPRLLKVHLNFSFNPSWPAGQNYYPISQKKRLLDIVCYIHRRLTSFLMQPQLALSYLEKADEGNNSQIPLSQQDLSLPSPF